ncbi:Protein-disulfide isomerase [Chitinophaga rupis]|uniref:Protein-disulfide isomerase n=1 Tax=Chitinophaga rupis TaxID=573321 RepID=A0A1H7R2A6_9BACT|nr:vitamin K epoxide reductase family protein [Chitinophaga rupis]SEL54380.1 Protein-disulfide isomerase [Chitinophaga rupis]
MGPALENTVYNWLRLLHIPVSEKYLKEKIATHPEYPSLLSITDTLTGLGIENGALVIGKDKIGEVQEPVLAFVSANNGEFVLIRNLQQHAKAHPDFLQSWDGIIVVAENAAPPNDKENAQQLKKEKADQRLKTAFAAGFVLISLLPFLHPFLYSWSLFSLSTLSGIGIAILIVQKELGYSNSVTEQLCSAGSKTDCDAVMHSGASRLFNRLSWADTGIIYFTALWFLQTFFTTGMVKAVPFITLAPIPFTLFSIYYQWQQVKKWCTLCLLTVAVLWIQALLLTPVLVQTRWQLPSANVLLTVMFVFLFLSAAWLLFIKPVLVKLNETQDKSLPLMRFKRDPEVFLAVLEKGIQVDTTAFDHDLQLGDPFAPLQVMVACNPYCAPCAKAHQQLNEILSAYGDVVGITIRFLADADEPSDARTVAARYILQYWLEKAERLNAPEKSMLARTLLDDWFAHMDYETFAKKYPASPSPQADVLLAQHAAWCGINAIVATPAIFLQGYALPKHYNLTDLKKLIPPLSENITQAATILQTV